MNKKVRFLSVAASMALAASLGTPALAANSGAVPVTGGTDVYAGVTTNQDASKTNLKVTVPTLFSFVVVGSSDGAGKGVAVNGDNLLLPNVKVDAAGNVSTVGQSQLYFTNYSTKVDTSAVGGTTYDGLAVEVTGAVSTAGTSSQWEYSSTVPTENQADAYKYYMTLNTKPFNQGKTDGSYACETPVKLGKPNVSKAEHVGTDNTALEGVTQAVNISVQVGGKTGDYGTGAPSAKVGTIVWTVAASTAP